MKIFKKLITTKDIFRAYCWKVKKSRENKKEIKVLENKFIIMLEQIKEIYLHFNKDLPAYLQHESKNIDALLFKIIPDSMDKKEQIYSATEKIFYTIIPMTVFSLKNTRGKELLN